MPEDSPRAQDGDGNTVHPGEGSFPILRKDSPTRLSVIGTGFWVTRYGLFLTAKHVVEDSMTSEQELRRLLILHVGPAQNVHLRPVRMLTAPNRIDLAIGQAETYEARYLEAPIQNRRARLSTAVPEPGSRLVTYAFPENAPMDFGGEHPPTLVGDMFQGEMLRSVGRGLRPFIPNPHFETSIPVRSGASGGPVFSERGYVVGVNSRGWDFDGSDEEGHLSSVVPIGELMPITIDMGLLPSVTWEARQIPAGRRGEPLTFSELVTYGHVVCEAPG